MLRTLPGVHISDPFARRRALTLCNWSDKSFGFVVKIAKLPMRSPASERQVSDNPASATSLRWVSAIGCWLPSAFSAERNIRSSFGVITTSPAFSAAYSRAPSGRSPSGFDPEMPRSTKIASSGSPFIIV